MLFSSVQGDFLERVKLPLQPSLQQVIGVLHRVDPALGNLAETVSKVTRLIKHHTDIDVIYNDIPFIYIYIHIMIYDIYT